MADTFREVIRREMSEVERVEYRELLGEQFVENPDLVANTVIAFTDGSARVKTREGGWGAVLLFRTTIMELWGGFTDTTVNAMELTAILRALQEIKPGKAPIHLYSDSRYSVDALTSWCHDWARNDWTTGGGSPVKNADLIRVLMEHPNRDRTAIRWLKGHAEIFFNEVADDLAGRYKTREEHLCAMQSQTLED